MQPKSSAFSPSICTPYQGARNLPFIKHYIFYIYEELGGIEFPIPPNSGASIKKRQSN